MVKQSKKLNNLKLQLKFNKIENRK